MQKNLCKKLADNFSGPILFEFVWWVLNEAQRRSIKRLYFLARDGYLLREIAECFCREFSLPIDCRYLYCSRMSLRLPSYHLIGEEAYEQLLLDGYNLSLRSILQRIELDEEERMKVYAECGLSVEDETRLLGHAEFEQLKPIICRSSSYRTLVQEKSIAAYESTIGYLRQEGLTESPSLALVDSGWSGSMQRTLRWLLQSMGYTGKFIGFYYGMYEAPKSEEDGEYLTWYFSKRGKIGRKMSFNNNLFECLLSAPHGMTEKYFFDGERYVPQMLPMHDNGMYLLTVEQIDNILRYTEERLRTADFVSFSEKQALRDTDKRIRRYMMCPKREEAEYYGRFFFCDDVTEAYHISLASAEQTENLVRYTLTNKIYRHLFPSKDVKPAADLLWIYGVVAFLPRHKQAWYRWNIYIWEWLRFLLY